MQRRDSVSLMSQAAQNVANVLRHESRYTYYRSKSLERAESALEDAFANGEISEGERPRIEAKRDHSGKVTHYELTLSSR